MPIEAEVSVLPQGLGQYPQFNGAVSPSLWGELIRTAKNNDERLKTEIESIKVFVSTSALELAIGSVSSALASVSSLVTATSAAVTSVNSRVNTVAASVSSLNTSVSVIQFEAFNKFSSDLLGSSTIQSAWTFGTINKGSSTLRTFNLENTTLGRNRGIYGFSRDVASPNSGAYLRTHPTGFSFRGGESSNFIIYPEFLTSTQAYIGFTDTNTVAAPTDGCYFKVNPGGIITGVAVSNGVATSTAALLTVSTSTWYQLNVSISPTSASTAYFTIYNMAASVLASGNVTSNIPSDVTRTFGNGMLVYYETSGGTNTNLISLDYLDMTLPALTGRGTINP